jgi:hypothetical protein
MNIRRAAGETGATNRPAITVPGNPGFVQLKLY